jgi:hypothetical protein
VLKVKVYYSSISNCKVDLAFLECIVKTMYLEKPKQLIIWNGGTISQDAHGQPNMQLMALASCSLELLIMGATQGIRLVHVYLHKRCSADKGQGELLIMFIFSHESITLIRTYHAVRHSTLFK